MPTLTWLTEKVTVMWKIKIDTNTYFPHVTKTQQKNTNIATHEYICILNRPLPMWDSFVAKKIKIYKY